MHYYQCMTRCDIENLSQVRKSLDIFLVQILIIVIMSHGIVDPLIQLVVCTKWELNFFTRYTQTLVW